MGGTNSPGPSWYSRYWLEDKPWPDVAFIIGRLVGRIARIAISAVCRGGVRSFDSIPNTERPLTSARRRPAQSRLEMPSTRGEAPT
jgi:hypothetical protein